MDELVESIPPRPRREKQKQRATDDRFVHRDLDELLRCPSNGPDLSAARLLLERTLPDDRGHHRLNFAEQRLPESLGLREQDLKRVKEDEDLLTQFQNASSSPCISEESWTNYVKEWTAQLQEQFPKVQNLKVSKVEIEVSSGETVAETFGKPKEIDLDVLMEEEGTHVVLVYDKHQPLVATLLPNLCLESYGDIAGQLGFKDWRLPNQLVKDGLHAVAEGDRAQKAEAPSMRSVNVGATVRPQPVSKCEFLHQAMGGPRGGYFKCPEDQSEKVHASDIVASKYIDDYMSVFPQEWVTKEENFYGERLNHLGKRTPRFSLTSPLRKRQRIQSPYVMMDSLPIALPPKKCSEKKEYEHYARIAFASWENDLRTVEEVLLHRIFGALPFSNLGDVAASRMQNAIEKAREMRDNKSLQKGLPFESLCRALPKGAAGVQAEKTMHDDGNAALIPGMWTGVTECTGARETKLAFFGRNMNVVFKITEKRFALFYGWIPHKSFVVDNAHGARPKRKRATYDRIHHSSFSKPEIEMLALSMFHESNIDDVLTSYEIRGGGNKSGKRNRESRTNNSPADDFAIVQSESHQEESNDQPIITPMVPDGPENNPESVSEEGSSNDDDATAAAVPAARTSTVTTNSANQFLNMFWGQKTANPNFTHDEAVKAAASERNRKTSKTQWERQKEQSEDLQNRYKKMFERALIIEEAMAKLENQRQFWRNQNRQLSGNTSRSTELPEDLQGLVMQPIPITTTATTKL